LHARPILGMRCHWLKRDAETFRQSLRAAAMRILLLELVNGVLNRWFLVNANVDLLKIYTCLMHRARAFRRCFAQM